MDKVIIMDNILFNVEDLSYMIGYKDDTRLYFKHGGWWSIPDEEQEKYKKICKLITGE